MRERRTYLRSIAAVATGITLAGCTGNGDGDGGGSDGGATPTATATATPAADTTSGGSGTGAQEEYPDYNWDQLDDAEPTATTTVTMSGFAFHPLIARVPPGATVSFPNEDSSPHTVTIPALGVDRQVSGGGETTVTVEEPGTYDYVCTIHGPSMLGRLVVEEGVTVGDGGTGETATGGATTADGGVGY